MEVFDRNHSIYYLTIYDWRFIYDLIILWLPTREGVLTENILFAIWRFTIDDLFSIWLLYDCLSGKGFDRKHSIYDLTIYDWRFIFDLIILWLLEREGIWQKLL